MLTSSSVPETDHAAWASNVTYAAAARVQVVGAGVHKIFESVQNGNLNKNPMTDDGTWWFEVGPTNRWKMFDLLRNTGTTSNSAITVVLTPGERVNAVALVGLLATSVTISQSVSGYTYTESLSIRGTTSWYEYFFGAFSFKTVVARFNLPPITGSSITLTIVNTAGPVTVGGVILGMSVYLGETQYQPVDSQLNFSTIERDSFGTTNLIQRRSVPKTNQKVMCSREDLAKVRKARESLNAVPALWAGIDDSTHEYFEPLLILGIYKQFDVSLDYPEDVTITLELEEV